MKYGREETSESRGDFFRYLQSWGLREFHDEASYYQWQHSILSEHELQELHRLIEQRHGGENIGCDIEFYDVLARQDLVPVLYSQRFHYFLTIGWSISKRIQPANCVLDFGCGVGILTIFFAQQYPGIEFVGIDRSSQSIETAVREAEKRQLRNIRFEISPVSQHPISGNFDLILSTQTLFQAEREPGLPSRSWRTFQRVDDRQRQEQLEIRTGLGGRLDTVLSTLHPKGRMLVFEKTWNLGRRIFLQRALEARGLRPISSPVFCRYRSLDEELTDGPLYEVARIPREHPILWNEDPYREPGETLYRCIGGPAVRMESELALHGVFETVSGVHSGMGSWSFRFGGWKHVFVWGLYKNASGFNGLVIGGEEDKDLLLSLIETVRHIHDDNFVQLVEDFWGHLANIGDEETIPCYENHHPSAQIIYEMLPSKHIQQESSFQDREGKESHIELGTTSKLVYMYRANTFDQRQLVVMDEKRAHVLKSYYWEFIQYRPQPSS